MKSPLKFFGGKSYIAKDIVSLFPPLKEYKNYVEAYCGGASVFFAATERHKDKKSGVSEVLNDKWSALANFYNTLRDPITFGQFYRTVALTPFSEEAFHHAKDFIEYAAAFFICNRMSWAGRMQDFAAITKNRLRGGRNEQVNAWLGCIEGLPEIALRLQDALILNRDAEKLIVQLDSKETLFYLDPPYLLETRTNKSGGEYEHEMSYEEHCILLEVLKNIKGKFLLSCYENDLYQKYADEMNWKKYQIHCKERSSGSGNERIEVVYANY